MSDQGQFGVDEQALRNAIGKLEETREKAKHLARSSTVVFVEGELTAKDHTTGRARTLFQDRLNGAQGSLREAAAQTADKIETKIEAYKAALDDYLRAEDNATVDGHRLEGQA